MRVRLLITSAFVALLAASCGDSSTHEPSTVRQSLGEPMEGYPSYEERLIHYFTNRARTEPTAFNPDDPYPPTAPLAFDLDLAKAARFHARHIIEKSCYCDDHTSCCELGGSGDGVACIGPVTGCGATTASERATLFSPSYSGENQAMGQPSAWEVMQAWIFSAGHWQNINSPVHTKLGPGYFPVAWVQDFGRGGAPGVLGDGIHFSGGEQTRFGATYWQEGTGGPRTALVIVEGKCLELDVVYGEPEWGAFETATSLDPGCHRYYFYFEDGNGQTHTYPSFGSFGVSAAGAACPFFVDTRPADTCSPSGQTCVTGDTRHCYTGPFGTEDVGICEAGVERCVGGQWTGECRLETLPAQEETCGNADDDDCDGEVDEECDATEDGPAEDVGNFEPDMGTPTTDAGSETEAPAQTSEPEPRGCATADGSASGSAFWILVGVLLAGRRRRTLE